MEIDTKMNWRPVNGLPSVKNSGTGAEPAPLDDSFAKSTALEGALQNTPDVRPAAVANARALVDNANYPSADTVKKLSDFLAGQFSAGLD